MLFQQGTWLTKEPKALKGGMQIVVAKTFYANSDFLLEKSQDEREFHKACWTAMHQSVPIKTASYQGSVGKLSAARRALHPPPTRLLTRSVLCALLQPQAAAPAAPPMWSVAPARRCWRLAAPRSFRPAMMRTPRHLPAGSTPHSDFIRTEARGPSPLLGSTITRCAPSRAVSSSLRRRGTPLRQVSLMTYDVTLNASP